MTVKLSPTADRLADQLKKSWNRNCEWESLREQVDYMTGSDCSTVTLDRLTDMVKRRLPAR